MHAPDAAGRTAALSVVDDCEECALNHLERCQHGQVPREQVLKVVQVALVRAGWSPCPLAPAGPRCMPTRTSLQVELDRAGETSAAAAGWTAKTPQQGAATSVLLAVSPLLEGVGGRYFDDCQESDVVPEIVDGHHGVRDYALDPVAATRLWDVSEQLLAANNAARP